MKLEDANNLNNEFRYERKFGIVGLPASHVEQLIKQHPAMFSEIFHKRYINNIYFDDNNFTNYYQNLSGQADRLKYRIRWYGDLLGMVDNPVLEIKVRQGYVGSKPTYRLRPFNVFEGVGASVIKDSIGKSDLPDEVLLPLQFQMPVIANRYARKYYRSADKKFRVTIDTDISYYRLGMSLLSFKHCIRDYESVVMEIKYDVADEDKIMEITSQFPFRLTRNSKYANGVDSLYLY